MKVQVKVKDVKHYFTKRKSSQFELRNITGGGVAVTLTKEGTIFFSDELRKLLETFDVCIAKNIDGDTYMLIC